MKPSRFSRKNREYIKWDKTHKEVRITPKAKPGPAAPAQLEVEADDAAAQGVYADMSVITHTATEFLLDFIFRDPARPQARVVARIISGDIHARRFCEALRQNIKNYEARFGPIKE
ncbi:MAG: DUF3467 domain-containing protein [Elusimicrobia bacterium CG08_land_8_20_14_0_20_59_10]|nr:MAG: DUF3467 domain-containing protein [Elusimicrobia bacterium CG08_land_8_20_14_0_20_59_10]